MDQSSQIALLIWDCTHFHKKVWVKPKLSLACSGFALILVSEFGFIPNFLEQKKGGYRMGNAEERFAECLRMYRAKADVTQAELAKSVGVDAQSVINWEKGVYMPSLRTTVKLADALGVSIDQLAGR
jgi:DNA-binding XRE family transcriptional regulator